jgi:hypothetical protein
MQRIKEKIPANPTILREIVTLEKPEKSQATFKVSPRLAMRLSEDVLTMHETHS